MIKDASTNMTWGQHYSVQLGLAKIEISQCMDGVMIAGHHEALWYVLVQLWSIATAGIC